ncbi:GGDEF domain-containing protein [Streptomyces olivoreticuli]|uniref:GGDEF domain-containing protein n=1 Tax=Streptomyces olivoreticuli TaxID=68246 RepID=UPI00265A3A9F|nr:GGDEF domain-containing protein [Streptomyces olivoreticuli]WKK24706.1 GGDEF domain-containing protein [Streptomyces olivoreticuli]
MDTLVPVSAAAAPLLAGWSLHTAVLRRMLRQARQDPLTGLPGRKTFMASAGRDLRRRSGVVVLMDLDGFKAVNDTHGHAAGDTVLAAAGRCLAAWAESLGGTAARLGGDEFVATAFPAPTDDLPGRLRDLHFALSEPVWFRETELAVGASVGAFETTKFPSLALGRALRRAVSTDSGPSG